MMMGNCEKRQNGVRRRQGSYGDTIAEDFENWTDCEELPVLLHSQRSGTVGFIKGKVPQEKVDRVLKSKTENPKNAL